MKTFTLPDRAWLPSECFNHLVREHDEFWREVEEASRDRNVANYTTAQNQAMLLKFFLEQAFGKEPPFGKSLQIIERDFGSVEEFSAALLSEAGKDKVRWLVFGLSFADFRFHLFPIENSGSGIPFCVSPMMCMCLREDVIALSKMSRQKFAALQLDTIDWGIVEQRIKCLEYPLNIFEDGADCVEGACETETDAPVEV